MPRRVRRGGQRPGLSKRCRAVCARQRSLSGRAALAAAAPGGVRARRAGDGAPRKRASWRGFSAMRWAASPGAPPRSRSSAISSFRRPCRSSSSCSRCTAMCSPTRPYRALRLYFSAAAHRAVACRAGDARPHGAHLPVAVCADAAAAAAAGHPDVRCELAVPAAAGGPALPLRLRRQGPFAHACAAAGAARVRARGIRRQKRRALRPRRHRRGRRCSCVPRSCASP